MKYKIKLKHVMLCCYYLLFNLLQGATKKITKNRKEGDIALFLTQVPKVL